MYTTHGHHIYGTILTNDRPKSVARCGGVGLCAQCSREAAAVIGKPPPAVDPEPETGQDVVCKNCGYRIVLINYVMGPAWMHQPAGSSFNDNVYEFCHLSIAEPKE